MKCLDANVSMFFAISLLEKRNTPYSQNISSLTADDGNIPINVECLFVMNTVQRNKNTPMT